MAPGERWSRCLQEDRMEQCKCPNCGAAINVARMICEYCGTTFKRNDVILSDLGLPKIVIQRPGIKVLGVNIAISGDQMLYMEQEDIEAMICSEMSHKIAQELVKHLDIKSRYDMSTRMNVFSAKLRVLDPEYKF